MRELQRSIIDQLGVRPQIDPAQEIRRRVDFLVEYLRATGAHGFVLGISGGVDSTLAGRLAQLAVERVRAESGSHHAASPDPVFAAMRLPHRVQADEEDAQAALRFIAPDEVLTMDIGPATDALAEQFAAARGHAIRDFDKGNVKARLRMVAQYAVGGDRGLLVIGTDHAAENITGFFTKHGDGAADVLPLSGLDKRQVRALVQELGGPEALRSKIPTADLLDERPGQTDETELGLSYDVIDDYLEGREVPEQAAQALEARWRAAAHKRTGPVTLLDDWWRR